MYSIENQLIVVFNKKGHESITISEYYNKNRNIKKLDELSKWINDELLKDTEELSEATKAKIKAITENEKDVFEKVKKIYECVQSKTRYISIQLGIGSWKPMLAKDVDKSGYGDCKALSNYARVLLKNIGIPSYYSIVYGSNEIRDIDESSVSLQGNHAILTVPINNEVKWLECTSQTCPVDFSVNFTDNRKVFVIKLDGSGSLITSKNYNEKTNFKKIEAVVNLNQSIGFTSQVKIISKGTYYDEKYPLEKISNDEFEKFYKNELNNLQEMTIEKIASNSHKK